MSEWSGGGIVVQLGSACFASCPNRPGRSWRFVCAATCLAALLAGCSGLSSSPRSPLPDDAAALEGLAANYEPQSVNTCLRTPLAAQDACRNTIVQAMMAAIDLRYVDFELGLFDANRYGNFGATLATLGLTTAGSLSGGGMGRALAAAAAGLTGARESFNREVLIEHTVLALQASMQARRNEVALRIREGLRRPALDYPLGVALSDTYAYFRGGTLVGALVGVTESASATAARARGLLNASVVRPQLLDRSSALDLPLPQPSVDVAPRASDVPARQALPPRTVPRGLDTGDVATAMRGWLDAAGTPDGRRSRRAAIEREAQAAGYDRDPVDARGFIGDTRPGVAPMKERVARVLQIIP